MFPNRDIWHSAVIIAVGMLEQLGCPQWGYCGLLNETLSGRKQKQGMFSTPFQMEPLEGVMSESYLLTTLSKQSVILKEVLGRPGIMNHRNRWKIGVEILRAVGRWEAAACQGEEGLLQKEYPRWSVLMYTVCRHLRFTFLICLNMVYECFLMCMDIQEYVLGHVCDPLCIQVWGVVHTWISFCVCEHVHTHLCFYVGFLGYKHFLCICTCIVRIINEASMVKNL